MAFTIRLKDLTKKLDTFRVMVSNRQGYVLGYSTHFCFLLSIYVRQNISFLDQIFEVEFLMEFHVLWPPKSENCSLSD